MGEHDQVVLYDKDAHQSATDDGRTLRPVGEDEYEYFGGISEMPALVPPYESRQVLLYHGQKFIPETVYIRPAQVRVTEWESMYSSAFTLNRAPFSVATFSPIVDDSLKLVGHLGWADGNDIIVPEYTVRNDRRFWSILQNLRLSEERQRLLDEDARWDRARPFPDSPLGRPTTSAPKDPRRWRGPEVCNPRPHAISLETRRDEAHRGPLKDKSTEETYRIDLELFVTGGGKAFVGRHFVQRGDASYLAPAPGVPDERIDAPKKPFSSGYEFLVIVDPEGHLRRVLGVRKNLYSHADEMMFMLELALTMSVLLDIGPIAVALLAAGVRITMRVMIQAVKLIIDREAKEIMEVAFKELARAELAAIRGGTVLAEGPLVSSSNMNIARETAGTGGIRAISGVRAADGSKKIVVQGYVRPSIGRQGFETRLVSGKDLGIPTYQRLHLWGPRLGDEAAAGIWLGPGAINIGEQARVEKLLQDLAMRAQREGGVVQLQITGTTHAAEALPTRFRAHEFVSELTYEFRVVTPGTETLSGRVTIEIGPPPNGSIRMLGAENLP